MKAAGTYTAYLEEETWRVIIPYLFLAAFALLWALLLWRSNLPEIKDNEDDKISFSNSLKQILKNKNFVKGVLAQFLYVGAQVGTWSYFIMYVQQYTGESEKIAGYMLSGTLVAFTLGRLSATALMKHIDPARLMGIYRVMNILLLAISIQGNRTKIIL